MSKLNVHIQQIFPCPAAFGFEQAQKVLKQEYVALAKVDFAVCACEVLRTDCDSLLVKLQLLYFHERMAFWAQNQKN